jgi:hypothetical protein
VYESDAGAGFPSDPHVLPISLPTDTWVEVELDVRADDPLVQLTLDGDVHEVELGLLTPAVMSEIAGIVPVYVVGSTVNPGTAGCAIDYDDLTVTVAE